MLFYSTEPMDLKFYLSSCSFSGSFPGTVLFGSILDHSCVLWEEKCSGTGSCLYYNNSTMAFYMLALVSAAKVLSSMCSCLAWRLYKKKNSTTLSVLNSAVSQSTVTLHDITSELE